VAPTRTSPEGITEKLAKALAHPLRMRILTVLNEGVASPTQLSQQLGEPLGNVSYHVKTLLEFDCIELVKTEPRRGAVEHFYRATERAFLSDEDWAKLPLATRKGLSGVVLETIGEDVSRALTAGTLERRSDTHISRTPLILDEQGCADLTAVLAELLERSDAIQTEAAARINAEKGDSIGSKLVILHFETPAQLND
jgi:DNA-binding transcriptional ArsR family regulator